MEQPYEEYARISREQLLIVLAKLCEGVTVYQIRKVGKIFIEQGHLRECHLTSRQQTYHSGGWSMWDWPDRVTRHLNHLIKKEFVTMTRNGRGHRHYRLTQLGKREAFLLVL